MAVSVRVFPPFPRVEATSVKAGRDIALDVVRSWSLLVVVLGHFIMEIIRWNPDGSVTSSNTLSSGSPWPFATWLLQVMPLFFIAGGAVNYTSWQHFEGTWSQWVWQRINRLMRPTVVFLAFLAVLFTVLTLLLPQRYTDVLLFGVSAPLWFLAVYIPVTALTPVTSRWFQARPAASLVVLAVLVVATDVLRLHANELLGALNLLVVWVLVHQLGYYYDRGVRAPAAGTLIITGLTLNIILTQVLHWYPTSLVGLPGEPFSNMAPPDLILLNHSLVLFGLFCLIAPWLRRAFSRQRPFSATVKAGLVAMTVYLWHMLVLVAWLTVLHWLGADLPVRSEGDLIVPDGPAYWLWLIPSTLGFAALLYCVVRWLWPLEHVKLPWFDTEGTERIPHASAKTAVGVALLAIGILATAGAGFSGFPVAIHEAYGLPLNAAAAPGAIALGLVLVRQPRPSAAVETRPQNLQVSG